MAFNLRLAYMLRAGAEAVEPPTTDDRPGVVTTDLERMMARVGA